MTGLLPTDLPVVVVDCETTGLSNRDRNVEIAAVTLDPRTGEIVDEYDTLINPERDTGPSHIHGVTASMVQAAPTFDEVVAALSRRLNNAVLVAHNLPFDSRMLRNDFARLGIGLDLGSGICTYRLSGEKLASACHRFGIDTGQQHRALTDARASAALLRVFAEDVPRMLAPVQVEHIPFELNTRTLRRSSGTHATNDMVRVVSDARYPYSDEAILHYLDALDWMLDDHVIEDQERAALFELAQSYGLDPETVADVHRSYLTSIIAAAMRDGVITNAEHELIDRTRAALMVEEVEVPRVTALRRATTIQAGMRVCFTGSVTVNGQLLPRPALESLAAQAGLQPTGSVTKRGCDLLVAADPTSMSGKARNARKHDIAVISAAQFLAELGVD